VGKDKRRREILEIVSREGKITISEICELFDVSDMTARRDLRDLDREGLLRRIHGGAVSALGRSYEPPYRLRSTKNVEQKQAIGKRAAELVFDGDSIAIDVGTTTIEMVEGLQERRNLTIITASIPIANRVISTLSLNSSVRLILTGGIVRPGELSMIGHLAERAYEEFRVDKAFIGIGGLSSVDGLTEYNLEDALVKRLLVRSANQKIVVADGSKLGRTSFVSIASLDVINTIITDDSAPSEVLQAFREKDVEVIAVSA
jgi:DeoR/GlpR family transcriptional regulator of sugar metabolism